MSIPIPPSPLSPTPITSPNPFFGTGSSLLKPVDNTSPSLAASLAAPTIDASSPQLSIAQFYGTISTANIGQKLREFIDQMTDPAFRKELMTFALQQASYMAEIITLVYRYDSLANQLENLKLKDKADKINDTLNGVNAGLAADNAAIATFNSAINSYNVARNAYEGALATYQTALNAFEDAQNTYDQALSTWNGALGAYQSGSITQAELESARATFNAAAHQFENVNKPNFNTALNNFDTAKTNFQTAVASFETARTTYNNYVASRTSAFNDANNAINEWNTSAVKAKQIIAQMNLINAELGLTHQAGPVNIEPLSGLIPKGPISGPNALRDAVQIDVDQDNVHVAQLNAMITTIGNKVTAINAGGYTPPLTTPLFQSLIPSLPTANSGTAVLPLSPLTAPPSITIQVPEPRDLITDYLLPRLSILEALKINNEQENRFRVDVTDEKLRNSMSGQNVATGALGSSNLTATNALGIAASPFLSAILSKHAFEAFFNTQGVPVSSNLVDQIGALYSRISANAGLLSAGPAQKILNNAVLMEANGKKAVEAAIALGYLDMVNTLSTSPELSQAVSKIVLNDPLLASLTAIQKNELIDSIVGEIRASLNKAALNELARALGLPGLMPQILAVLAGITEKDPLASFSQQLYRNVIFAKELAKAFAIPDSEVDDIMQRALAKARNANTFSFNQAAIDEFVTSELQKEGALGVDIAKRVQLAALAAEEQVKAEAVKSDAVKKQSFQDSLLKGLTALEWDPVKADLMVSQIPLAPIKEIVPLLVDKGLTLPEANQVALSALNAANQKDPLINPLSNFLIKQMGTTTEMAGLLKAQIVNILSPAVGMRQALQVGEDYGSLIFTRANSITTVLTANERNLDALSQFDYEARLYENYKEATKSYISPQLASDSPLRLGMTLLLTGIPGGLSNQGVTSADNTLGPSASQTKHATFYPGIFG